MSPKFVKPSRTRLPLPDTLEEAERRVRLLTKAKSLFEQQSKQSVRSHRYRALLNHLEVAKEDFLCFIEKDLFGSPFSRKQRYLPWHDPKNILDHYPEDPDIDIQKVRINEPREDRDKYKSKFTD